VGGIVAADKGADTDLMFLAFDKIGSSSHPYTIPQADPPVLAYTGLSPPLGGVKFYGQINAAMSQITGVPVTTQAVNTLYNSLQQSLPTSNDLSAFVASEQTAISQLADLYCTTALNTAAIKTATFPNLDLTQTAASYFGPSTAFAPPTPAPALTAQQMTNRALVINPLVNAVTGGATVNSNEAALIASELNTLMSTLVGTDGVTTTQAAQGACSAVLGSAAVSLQ
jgi:hypothetical protein